MNGRRNLVARLRPFGLAAAAVVALWAVYERAVAGPSYRWTTWRELTLDREPVPNGPRPNLSASAIALAGQAVFLVAQKGDWFDGSADHNWPTIEMPHRDDFDRAAIDVGVNTADRPAFVGSDGWGVIRIWGRIRLAPVGAHALPAAYKDDVPLEIDVDRVEEDPPFLPAAIPSTTPVAWAAWAVSAGLTAAAAAPAARVLRRLARVRAIALTTSVTFFLIALVVAVVWTCVPGVAIVDIDLSRSIVEAAAGRSGFFIHWTGDYAGYAVLPVQAHLYRDYVRQPALPLGLDLHSYYTRYDRGNVHAHADLTVSPLGMIGVFGLLSYIVFRCRCRTKATPGRCARCGYDLRALHRQRAPNVDRLLGKQLLWSAHRRVNEVRATVDAALRQQAHSFLQHVGSSKYMPARR